MADGTPTLQTAASAVFAGGDPLDFAARNPLAASVAFGDDSWRLHPFASENMKNTGGQ
jgi:hypothetical protein